MIGQTEAFEVPPTRRLLVKAPNVNIWGVDPSTLRVAVATITPDGLRGAETCSFPRLDNVPRLVQIRRRTYAAAALLAELIPPGLIVVEKPAGFGDRPSPELAYAAGVIVCALAEAAPAATVELIESAKWKKVSCGYGAIKKPKPTDPGPYRVLAWAQTLGYDGSSWDEADAMGIAEWGRKTIALEVR